MDAGVSDAEVDAGPDIPARPDLASCGFGAPASAGRISDSALREISGLVVSRTNARVLWIVQDSGFGSLVHAVNDLAEVIGTYGLGGVAIDCEDIAIGPGPLTGVDYLCIGDIDRDRPEITVYRVPEPVVTWDQAPVTTSIGPADALPMTYPPGLRDNAEVLMVDPDTADIYVVTKNGFVRPNNVFVLRAPHTPGVAWKRSAEKRAFGASVGIRRGLMRPPL